MVSGKKILYIITQSKFGGAQKYVIDLAQAFALHNAVTVAVGEPQDRDPAFFDTLAAIPAIDVVQLQQLQRGISPLKNWSSVDEIRQLLQRVEPDIVHINSSMAGFTASLAAYWYNKQATKKVRVVYTAHGFVFDEPLPTIVKKIYTLIEKLGARWKDAIITVSDQSKLSGVRHHIAPSDAFTTIHNGISLQPAEFLDRQSARQALKLPPDVTIVGTIASHYPTKGLPYLIEAAKIIADPHVHFVIIGDGPQKMLLQEKIDAAHLSARFHLAGSQPVAWRYLKAFDIFVLPSVKEGHPYALLEAGLTPLPVVASKVGGIPEVIHHDHNGWLVPPADPAALAAAIQYALAHPEESQAKAQALLHTVSTDFSSAHMIHKTSQVYEHLLSL